MSTRKKTSAMVESALITAIAVIFALAGIYIPLVNVLLMFLPVPFIIIGAKNGFKYSILSLIVATFMIGSFTDPLRAILFFVTTGFGAITIGYMIKKKYSFSLTMFFGSIASIISVIISFALMPKIFGAGPIEMIESVFVQSREMYEGLIEMSKMDAEQTEQILSMIDQMKNLYLLIFPSAIIMSSVFSTYINYLLSGVILRRIGFTIDKPKKFGHFRLPTNFMMGALVIVILTYLASRFDIVNSDALNANIIYLFQIIFIIHGLAVASFLIEKKGIGTALRRTILIFILFIPIANGVLLFTGLFDVIFNIRKLGT
ncbi:DUF2232 domain-containing protein [Wukongibacter baidiensis]|uniref:YybS family protein n=1 Tax=Wukongibacter baidiensis TaxID=1723361 RepID=UPI003D7F3407